jgi:hypothetical protein
MKEVEMERKVHRGFEAVDFPEAVADGLQAHPAFIVYTWTCCLASDTVLDLGLNLRALAIWKRSGRAFGCPPALCREVQLLKANFGSHSASDPLAPDVRNPKIIHYVVSVW